MHRLTGASVATRNDECRTTKADGLRLAKLVGFDLAEGRVYHRIVTVDEYAMMRRRRVP